MTAADAPLRRVAVVVNPIKGDPVELRAVVAAAAARAGWDEPLWFETTVDDPGRLAAEKAIEQGATLVLAAGGDGTVRAVAAALRGSSVRLALLPRGTGNLLARNLGLPLELAPAVEIAFTGATRAIDVGIASVVREDGSSESHAFVVMVGIGLDADMIANTNPTLKKKVGWLAYVDSGVRILPGAPRFRIRYGFGQPERHHAHVSCVLIGNCGTLPGNMLLFPEAKVDDGVLDIAIMQPRTLFGWLAIWRKVTWENRVLRRFAVGRRLIEVTDAAVPTTMTVLRGPEFSVEVEEPRMFEIDGDEVGTVRALTTRIDAGSLVVMGQAGA